MQWKGVSRYHIQNNSYCSTNTLGPAVTSNLIHSNLLVVRGTHCNRTLFTSISIRSARCKWYPVEWVQENCLKYCIFLVICDLLFTHNINEYDCISNTLFFTKMKDLDNSKLLLPPANEVCEGYVFTGVCLSTGGCLPHCMLGYTPPGQTPPAQCMLGYTPAPLCSACWDTVNRRAVRIPLECILVYQGFSVSFDKTFR